MRSRQRVTKSDLFALCFWWVPFCLLFVYVIARGMGLL